MKRIMILSDREDSSLSWVTLLNALFPECKIEIRMLSPGNDGLKSDTHDAPAMGLIIDELAR